MQNNATAKPAPAEILEELTDWGITEFRELLTDLFSSYVCTKEWEECTDEWKGDVTTRYRIINRFFDKAEAWESDRMNGPQVVN